jgi:E3 ubiquitin-protein ligase synoviolin
MIGGHASFMMPPMPPAPINPALSDEEVRAMEGHERRAVEARIAFLRNMQVLLDCAAVQLQQYTSVLAALA